MNFLDTLDHVCIKAAHMVHHPQPELYSCATCSQDGVAGEHKLRLTLPTAQRMGVLCEDGKVLCPSCNVEMQHSGARRFAELHVQVCLDQTIHYPEMYRSGQITKEQYEAWFATLTDREKMGQYERVPIHHTVIRLSDADLAIKESDPAHFEQLVHSYLSARLEMDVHFVLQHRYKAQREDALNVLKSFSKSSAIHPAQRQP